MYDLLVGGPGETRETVRETIEFMRRIDADCVGVAMGVRVYDGTRMADWVRSQGDMASNPDLYRAKRDNTGFLKPVFYISPDMGEGIVAYLRELVGGDPRFFLPSNEEVADQLQLQRQQRAGEGHQGRESVGPIGTFSGN